MNQRIKELAKKAGATINQGFDGKKDFITSIYMSPEEFEKFAELIVRECAKFADRGTRGGIGELMKEHFGVGQ